MSTTTIKLLVLDIDGTIAGDSNQVSPRVKAAIKAAMAQNIQVAVATGRMYGSAVRFHQDINSQLPLIAYNGAWIQNPLTQELHQHLPVAAPIVAELLDYFESPHLNPHFGVHLYLEDRLYVSEITPESQSYAERCQVEAIAIGDLRQLLHTSPTKMLAMAKNPPMIAELLPDLRQRYSIEELHLTQSATDLLEAIHPQANKGKAVQYLAEKILGLKAENVMAIGDNFNDVEMLNYAGVGVAMGNAPAAVRQLADWIAPSVEEDGVAIAIDKLLLN